MAFVAGAKVDEIPVEKMKHVEMSGKEIMVANVKGKCYAVSDRCGHMNGRFSTGTLTENIVKCPFHYSLFDVTMVRLLLALILPQSTS